MAPRRSLSWSEGLTEARFRFGVEPEPPSVETEPPSIETSLPEVDPRKSPPPFPGEHRNQRVSYGGLRWVWRRRRDERGRYLPDDPMTPVDEAWHWVLLEAS